MSNLPSNYIDIVLPKGRKRDELIGLKKGLKPTSFKCHSNKCACHITNFPHYSTDRNDAWELWDELPLLWKLQTISLWMVYDYVSEKFAYCVSRLWLEWYYNNKWLKDTGIQIIPDDMIPTT